MYYSQNIYTKKAYKTFVRIIFNIMTTPSDARSMIATLLQSHDWLTVKTISKHTSLSRKATKYFLHSSPNLFDSVARNPINHKKKRVIWALKGKLAEDFDTSPL